MQISFSSNGKLRQLIGAPKIRLDLTTGQTVADALQAVAGRYGADVDGLLFGEQTGLLVLVNDEMIEQNDTSLNDGDEVTVLLPMAGG